MICTDLANAGLVKTFRPEADLAPDSDFGNLVNAGFGFRKSFLTERRGLRPVF